MSDDNVRINYLLDRLDTLLKKQENFSKEIDELRQEIIKLKSSKLTEEPIVKLTTQQEPSPIKVEDEKVKAVEQQAIQTKEQPLITPIASSIPKEKSNVEKFIGENLINKIGIAITVIGVAIGAKYSIEHQLISPLTRIILGYFVGLGLLGFAIKLKPKYENYSAVLLSGAIAIMYFITFAAYSFYDLIPQSVTFVLMVAFTAFAVIASLNYNMQVISIIGLVGAYAVPFLLSDGSGKYAFLFSYISIINIGILVIAFKRYWKTLFYSSFLITWLIFVTWFSSKFDISEHLALAFIFISIYFSTFYAIFLAYKLLQKEKFHISDILLFLSNSFIFFGFGYSILNEHQTGKELLGLFTLCNAIIHFGVGLVIFKQKLADRNLFYLVIGMVLVFLTIAAPIQLDGDWVTLIWTGEALLLFWIGTSKSVWFYERLSYALMILAFISLSHDWINFYNHYDKTSPETLVTPIFNVQFLCSMLFIASFSYIAYLNQKRTSSPFQNKELNGMVNILIPTMLIVALFFSFSLEISNYWNQQYANSALEISVANQDYPEYYWNFDLEHFKAIWLINYSLLFATLLSIFNNIKLKNKSLGIVNLIINGLAVWIFLTMGLYNLSELRDSYITQSLAEYYHRDSFNIIIRYVSFAFVALIFATSYRTIKSEFLEPTSKNVLIFFELFLSLAVIWIASSELISWMRIMESTQTYRFSLSILWGVSALTLIALGIWKNKKHLRIGAIVLFTVALLKLAFYDVAHMETIQKTILFVSLGILLLIISFLYNKYKHLI